MTDVSQILDEAETVLVVDWPSRDVLDALARSGYTVVVHGGPGPEDYSAYELRYGEVTVRHVGRPPQQADLVYSYRPIEELPEIVAVAKSVGAKAVWVQSGLSGPGAKDPEGCWMAQESSRRARQVVESGGLAYVDAPYIAEAVRQRGRATTPFDLT